MVLDFSLESPSLPDPRWWRLRLERACPPEGTSLCSSLAASRPSRFRGAGFLELEAEAFARKMHCRWRPCGCSASTADVTRCASASRTTSTMVAASECGSLWISPLSQTPRRLRRMASTARSVPPF
ncbi:unnamed protein product, partial [Pylaiella littoralis]